MRADIITSLKKKAEEVAGKFSNFNREKNTTNEVFSVSKITPLSETTAIIYFTKITRKMAIAFCYYIKLGSPSGYWEYFFPTDAHVLGMARVEEALLKIEKYNFEQTYRT